MDLGLAPDDRIVVLGSSGWFGRELIAMLNATSLNGASVLEIPGPSSPRLVTEAEIESFEPTVVLNFAFLTRGKVDLFGQEEFERINRMLTERFLTIASDNSVRLALTVSSGAAISEPDHPYGKLKSEEEKSALALASGSRTSIIIRAYSVSGGHVREPLEYALSDFILQAPEGQIAIKACQPVFRRYCSVSDVLTVALRSNRSGVLETGGDLVEMEDLASAVVDVVNPAATITRAPLVSENPSEYHSDDSSWQSWTRAAGVTPMNLREQILAAAKVLLG